MKIISKLNILLWSMCHWLSKFCFPLKPLATWNNGSIVFCCSAFGFSLVSHCKKPTRSPRCKIDENYLKVEFFCYWACTTFCPNLVFLLKPWATWLPLIFFCSIFGFSLDSYCKKPTRRPGFKIDENSLKEVPLLAVLTRNISSNVSPESLSICEYNS